MAKLKKLANYPTFQLPNKIKPWVEDRIKTARRVGEHPAARAAARFGAPAGVALIIVLSLISLISPKNNFQRIKEELIKNPNDFEAHLQLAEKFLGNNQFEEAEKALLLAQKIQQTTNPGLAEAEPRAGNKQQSGNILGEKSNVKLEELWEGKHYSDPEDIRQLIAAWERILEEKPDYRDGWLQLTILHYKLYEDEKARECLAKALDLDPNFEVARELEEIISN